MDVTENANVTVTFLPSGKRVTVRKGSTILESAQEAGEGIRSICGGKGSCGKCRVVLNKGEVEKNLEAHEKFLKLLGKQILACQSRLLTDAEVFIPVESRLEKQQILSEFVVGEREFNPAIRKEFYEGSFLPEVVSKKGYRLNFSPEIEEGDFTIVLRGNEIIAVEEGDTRDENFGLAVDVGTTTVVGALINLGDGSIVDVRSDYNGQIIYGEEVLSRVEFVRSRKDGLEKINRAIIDTINRLIGEIMGNLSSKRIYDIVIAGNTLMTHFFFKKDIEYLFTTSNPKIERKAFVDYAKNLGINSNPNAMVFGFPSVGKYVGGDIVADILASTILESGDISLLVDLGTNGEIVLGSEGWLISTSVASGPAFEGYEIEHGSRAVEGAIDHVRIKGGNLEYTVIGNTKPASICGSGLIDLLAELFKNGIVDFTGSLQDNERVKDGKFIVAYAEETSTGKDIFLTQNDIDTLIKSKAAVCAGIAVLLKKAGLSVDDITKFYIAGAFGYYINIENSTIIGLFPEFPNAEVVQIGNGSLAGAYMAMTSERKRKIVERIARVFTYFDLSTDPNFMEEYNSALSLPGNPELFPTIYKKYV
ncbi:Uncharacterized metal-binding protein [Archaeoglobus sulfaticallidus PM70-1]|uniref:Uncharacterized metal-binding protein n=1 Tax=Archaeoglobus sulfaticallidus PM70-1 TaxID=387631 RepID=N0BB23_9EURY|nr:ASKHA domain-containing protein [Archaeoglobus sulfaticallidus]AGK60198.1 Uncharacterized metal-binding protein [Archaeoglobus sulfaticallidus PM70-1]